jgi:hypothetical protein
MKFIISILDICLFVLNNAYIYKGIVNIFYYKNRAV